MELYCIGPCVGRGLAPVVTFGIPISEAEQMSRHEVWWWLERQNELQKEISK